MLKHFAVDTELVLVTYNLFIFICIIFDSCISTNINFAIFIYTFSILLFCSLHFMCPHSSPVSVI